jgi:hypothetical protein
MNIENYASDPFAARDIRRFPSELDRVPSRIAPQTAEIARKAVYLEAVASVESTSAASPTEPLPAPKAKPFSLWENGSFGFGDFLDIINPLHHIPIVATIYRNMSGDQIGAAPRVIGGAIWGRIGGLIAGVVNAVVEWWSGKDVGDHVYAAVFGDRQKVAGATALAETNPPAIDAAQHSAAAGSTPVSTSGDATSVTSARSPAAAAQQSDAMSTVALRSESYALRASSARLALGSYERNLHRRKADESLGIRFPA